MTAGGSVRSRAWEETLKRWARAAGSPWYWKNDHQTQTTESFRAALPAGHHRRVQSYAAPLLQKESDDAISRGEMGRAGGLPRGTVSREGSGGQHQMRELPALRLRLPTESHQDHASWFGGPSRRSSKRGEDAEGIRDQHASLHLLWLLPGSLSRGSHLPAKRLFPHRHKPRGDDLQQRKT